jgi:hypothetical protein
MTFIKSTAVQQFAASANSKIENWYIQKAKLKKRYPILTDNDLSYDDAKNGTIWNKLKIKFGLNKEEVQKIISTD